jgi:hypothetical protein
MVEDEVGDFGKPDPEGVVCPDQLPVVFLDVHEGVVRGGEHALTGIAAYLAVRMDLAHIQVVEARELGDDPAGGVIDVLALLHESAREGPSALRRFEIPLEQQQTELTLLEPEDDAVHGRVELGMDTVERLLRHDYRLSVKTTLAKIEK